MRARADAWLIIPSLSVRRFAAPGNGLLVPLAAGVRSWRPAHEPMAALRPTHVTPARRGASDAQSVHRCVGDTFRARGRPMGRSPGSRLRPAPRICSCLRSCAAHPRVIGVRRNVIGQLSNDTPATRPPPLASVRRPNRGCQSPPVLNFEPEGSGGRELSTVGRPRSGEHARTVARSGSRPRPRPRPPPASAAQPAR